jgi:hypothetical protein
MTMSLGHMSLIVIPSYLNRTYFTYQRADLRLDGLISVAMFILAENLLLAISK